MNEVFSSIAPDELKCEYKTKPLGIDVKTPRLSWITKSPRFNSSQSAYQIQVASNKNFFENNICDIWDSGKIKSSSSNQIPFCGNNLESNKTYFWRVKIWNELNEESSWSEVTFFSTGLFEQNDWKAKWISHQYSFAEKSQLKFLQGIDKWIWYPFTNPDDKYKTICLFKSFQVSNASEIQSANLLVTADEKFQLFINEKLVAKSDYKIFSWARPSSVSVKNFLRTGPNQIMVICSNSYVEKPGFIMKMEMYFSSGSSINIVTDESWQAAIESSNNSKLNAKVIALAGEKPWRLPDPDLKFNPAAYFRHSFKLDKKIARAFVYASALGLYHLRINEKDVSNDLLRPGWSDFNATVYYNSYEVTDILKSESENLINVILADGYYSGYCGWEKGRGYYGKIPSIKIQLMIDYDDGTNKIIYTNESWTSSEGPIREADILMGEVYDSNYEWLLESWESNSTTANFCPVIIKKDINPKMISYCAETIRNRYELSAQHIKRICDKKFIIDFGQNFAGFVRLKLFDVGRRKIILRFAEMLNSDGSIYTDNLRMARAQDIYYSRGDTQEIWQPTFTYHGFRYVEITGLDEVEYETAVGISIHSLTEQTGYFTSSDEKLNKLFSCILWNQRSNYIDIPTDCPQRDERLGWLGDAVSFFSTSAYNYDVSAFYTKWLRDLFRAQNEDGSLPPFVPFVDLGVGPVYFNSAGWADAGIITPHLFNGHYNDKALLSELYTQMKKFIHSLEANSQNYILPNTGYGDWLYRGDDTSKSLIATAYFAYDCYLMSIMADILEFKSDTEYYDTLFNKIKDSFRRTFINANGYIKDQTQTAAVLCLNFNLLEKEEREKAISFLIQSIIDSDYHVSTGFLGLSFILQVLTSFGRNDIAWKIITNDEFPSWFNFINLGATTLWERWDSYHPKSGFFDPTMNSFNHCSLGCIGEWLFTNLAGIQAVEPGFKKFKVNLFIPDDLMSLKVSFKSIYGVIKVSWNKKENFVFLNVDVPFNTQSIITIPSKEYEVNTKHSKIQQFEKYTILETGSGKYEIRWKSY